MVAIHNLLDELVVDKTLNAACATITTTDSMLRVERLDGSAKGTSELPLVTGLKTTEGQKDEEVDPIPSGMWLAGLAQAPLDTDPHKCTMAIDALSREGFLSHTGMTDGAITSRNSGKVLIAWYIAYRALRESEDGDFSLVLDSGKVLSLTEKEHYFSKETLHETLTEWNSK